MSLPTMTKTKWLELHTQLDNDVKAALIELKNFMQKFDSYNVDELEEAVTDCQKGIEFWSEARKNVEDFETFDKIDLLIGAILVTQKTILMQLQRFKNDSVFDPRET